MRTSRREKAYYILIGIHWIAIVLVAVFALIAVVDTSTWKTSSGNIWHPIRAIVVFLQSYQKLILAFAGPTVIVSKLMASHIGPAWLWRTIERLLTEYRSECFTKETLSGAEFHHRVTLFQHVDWRTWWFWLTFRCWWSCWRGYGSHRCGFRTPFSGWLIVVRRSGHTTKRTNVTFLAPDDADCAEGVAGQAWAENRRILIKGLPDLADSPDQDKKNLYADKTHSTSEWVEGRLKVSRKMPRSILAMPIEVDNRLWGVIVVDSRSPEGIKEGNAKGVQEFFVVVLGKLLKRV